MSPPQQEGPSRHEEPDHTSGSTPQVFISYSHDSPEHKARVLSVAEHLLKDGIDVILDQYVESDSPEEGWPRWMDRQIEEADFVLLVCTEIYRRVMGREQPGQGHDVLWEAHLIYQHIYNTATRNPKFIPVLLEGGRFEHIPTPVQGVNHYRPDTEDGYEALYRRLTRQPRIRKPPPGTLRSLPPENLREGLVTPEKRQSAATIWQVPYERNPASTGREEVFARLRAKLASNSAAALS